jgi:hypothetical protein
MKDDDGRTLRIAMPRVQMNPTGYIIEPSAPKTMASEPDSHQTLVRWK